MANLIGLIPLSTSCGESFGAPHLELSLLTLLAHRTPTACGTWGRRHPRDAASGRGAAGVGVEEVGGGCRHRLETPEGLVMWVPGRCG